MRPSRRYTVFVFLALLLAAALSTTAHAQNMQCIFMGTVSIADNPNPWSLEVRLLRHDSSVVRLADYNPATKAYAVSAFESDGFSDSDRVMFRITAVRDSGDPASVFIAHMSGVAMYIGGFPPVVETIDLFGNRPPGSFHLLQPPPGDTIQVTTHNLPIKFVWSAATDPDSEVVHYTLRVTTFGLSILGFDTTVTGITDTSKQLDITARLTVSSLITWWVSASDGIASTGSADTFSLPTSTGVVGVKDYRSGRPAEFALSQNFPNPFNPSTSIKFQLPSESHVKLTVYSLLGQEVAVLIDGKMTPGYKSVDFNPSGLPSGVYLYRLSAGSFTQVRKMLLVR